MLVVVDLVVVAAAWQCRRNARSSTHGGRSSGGHGGFIKNMGKNFDSSKLEQKISARFGTKLSRDTIFFFHS
jgi:hypothetical protein